MKLDGTVTIGASREKVFSSLIDPNVVSQCAPGLKSVEVLDPGKRFRIVVGLGFGSVMMTFDVEIEFTQLNPPGSASLKAHGKAPGNAVDVTSEMHLTEISPKQTELAWTADVNLVGSVAGLANRVMGGLTKKMSAAFFDCFRQKIEESTSVAV
jgi:carbon monoxide dehydrogenase subunit G